MPLQGELTNPETANTRRLELRAEIDDFDKRIMSGEALSKDEILKWNALRVKHEKLCIYLMGAPNV